MMRVKIRTKEFHCLIPVPVSLAGFAIRLLPERMFRALRAKTPEAYQCFVTREAVHIIVGECLDILKENRGLELVHVEASDGTFVSVKL